MIIRHSTERDFDRIMEIYSFARRYMAEHGNPDQWGPTNWPPEKLIHSDIQDGNSYVCVNDEGTVIGTFYFIQGRDIEPTYRNITDGAWLDDSSYGVVHRIARDGSEKGIGAFCGISQGTMIRCFFLWSLRAPLLSFPPKMTLVSGPLG